ncbi:MAG: hypothetical protein Q9M91_06300 [Candidatus Dojkabacteria bacterium]|nr:hypothetical protein [Candidatus Dojkabacteria bacterium]
MFSGNYSDFINKKGSDKPKDPTPKVAVVKKSESDEKKVILKEIKRIEDKLEDLKNKMFNLGDDFEKIEKISIKVKRVGK